MDMEKFRTLDLSQHKASLFKGIIIVIATLFLVNYLETRMENSVARQIGEIDGKISVLDKSINTKLENIAKLNDAADKSGQAITYITNNTYQKVNDISKLAGSDTEKLVEEWNATR